MSKIILTLTIIVFGFFALSVFATYGVQTKASNCIANQILPDPDCTPGAVLTTDLSIICKSGYTKTVRNVSDVTRQKVFSQYSIPYSEHSNYEVDHLISLELGGSNDISNLWPENSKIESGSFTKDKFENYLHSQICNGKMTVQEAQKQISGNWLKYYQESLSQNNKRQNGSSKNPDYALVASLISIVTIGSYGVYRFRKRK